MKVDITHQELMVGLGSWVGSPESLGVVALVFSTAGGVVTCVPGRSDVG